MGTNIKIGTKVKIINMAGEPQYTGKTGVVEYIDDIGQLHGTWGGCAIIPNEDDFTVIERLEDLNMKLQVIEGLNVLNEKDRELIFNYFDVKLLEEADSISIETDLWRYIDYTTDCDSEILKYAGEHTLISFTEDLIDTDYQLFIKDDDDISNCKIVTLEFAESDNE